MSQMAERTKLAQDYSYGSGIIAGPDLRGLIDLYWHGLSHVQNCLEDIEGSDGRHEYLTALRLRLVGMLYAMESALKGDHSTKAEIHQAALALENGVPTFGLTGEVLVELLHFKRPDVSAQELKDALLSLGEQVLARLPGDLPAAQGSSGQREVIRAMQLWSKAAEANGSDIGFLAERLADL